MKRRKLPVVEDDRVCGGCTVCCFVLGVEDVGKDEQQHCKHECTEGCAIQATKPEACKSFRCYWHLGILPLELRPDKVGAMVTQYQGMFLAAYETEHGAAARGAMGDYLAQRIRKGERIYVRSPSGWYRLELKEAS